MNEAKIDRLKLAAGVRSVFWCEVATGRDHVHIVNMRGTSDEITRAMCRTVPEGQTWTLNRQVQGEPVSERIIVTRQGDECLAVAVEVGHPVTKSIGRMMARVLK